MFHIQVVNHINGPHGCRLDEALKIVKQSNHIDAEAVMLEKLGNYQEAFDLLLNQFKNHLNMVFIIMLYSKYYVYYK